MILSLLFFSLAGGLLLLHLLSVGVTAWRFKRPSLDTMARTVPPVSILRPVSGAENNLRRTLRSTFLQDSPDYEILFCVADVNDAGVPILRDLITEFPNARARLLIGDETPTGNPKLDNLFKGWQAANHEWIVMVDSNLLLPRDYLRQLFAVWDDQTGLVSSPAVGTEPEGLWAHLEAAFLNGHQARWQVFADQLGVGFAQGKTLLWRRDILEAGGGLSVLGRSVAEDVASTILVHEQNLKVRLARVPFAQPLGKRRFSEVWQRQLRWARCRRPGFPLLYAGEILTGSLPGTLCLLFLVLTGTAPALFLPLYLLIWYLAETVLARIGGWPHGAADALMAILRDLMLPVIWLCGYSRAPITWRGNRVVSGTANGAEPQELVLSTADGSGKGTDR